MLAGVAATGEEEVFSIISAGIFLSEISHKAAKLRSTGAGLCQLAVFTSTRALKKYNNNQKKIPEIKLESGWSDTRFGSGCQERMQESVCRALRVWLVFISRTARERLV